MTQAQIEAAKFNIDSEDFNKIVCELKSGKITCGIDSKVAVIIKCNRAKQPYILIRNGKKCVKLYSETFQLLCDSKISTLFLMNYLHANMNLD